MPKYLFTGSYSAEGARGVLKEGGTGRRAATEKLVASLGGKVEAYYFDHGTYAGLSVTKLRKLDANVSGALEIVVASKSGYCVQLGTPSWFARGPVAAVNLGHC